jgi:hypothetical protein
VPLLASRLREKLASDIKAKELLGEARTIKVELVSLLKALTPSKDEAEARARRLESANTLASAVKKEMTRTYSGAVFGDMVSVLVVPESDLQGEVRKAWDAVAPMSIKTSDKVKKLLVHVLKWWQTRASERFQTSGLRLPAAAVETFLREVCTSKTLFAALGNAVFPYCSRSTIDTALIACILHVKTCDGMLELFHDKPRRLPGQPLRLSYAEDAAAEGEGAVDWGDVSFEDAPASKDANVEIVFAGNRYFRHWAAALGDFYVKNGGGAKVAMDDPRVLKLGAVLSRMEAVDAG